MKHYLSPLFSPHSVAVFGASERAASVGSRVFANLVSASFDGLLFPVNPKHEHVQGMLCHPEIAAITKPVEMAVIATPATTVPDILKQCGEKGVRAAAVLSAGFGEAGPEGKALQKEILKIARHYRIRLLGPNCLGLIRPSMGLNATFGKSQAHPGELALVSQSGALCTAILDWAEAERIGFSLVVSLGNAAEIDFGEVLDYLATDPKTRSILLYIEGIREARGFLSGLRAAARLKPVIVMKTGRHPAASHAAVSHTGALVGADDVFDAALDRAGVVRVQTVDELFSAARTLSYGMKVRGKRLAIVTNGGGPGVVAADMAVDRDLTIPDLSPNTLSALDEALPAHWSKGNPVDVLGDADPGRFQKAVRLCLHDLNSDGVLVMLTPQAMSEPTAVAREVIDVWHAAKGTAHKPILTCWMGQHHVAEAHRLFAEAGIPSFYTPEAAVSAFAQLWHYHRNQRLLLEVPGPLTDQSRPQVEESRRLVQAALEKGRTHLSSSEAKTLLAAFHIPVAETRAAATAEEAVEVASQLGFPVVMKIDSPDLSHKSDVDGVELNLRNSEEVGRAFSNVMERVRANAPEAKLTGVTLEKQWSRAHVRELLVGVVRDPVFGPVITFGWGGTTVEVLADRAVCLPPLNSVLIRRMIARTRVARLLGAFRNLPPVDALALEHVLLRLSELVCEIPEIEELDINPLSTDESGVCALDARVHLTSSQPRKIPGPGRYFAHMAIPPYPGNLVKTTTLDNGKTLTVRPIRPEDAEMEQRFVRNLSPEAKYFRFMQSLQELSPEMLVRFTQIDYDREMAFLASIHEKGKEVEIGIARYIINPDGESCEFAIVVADNWHDRGIGTLLMRTLMDEARGKGIKQIEGQVLTTNHPMLRLMRRLGFQVATCADAPDVKEVSLDL